MEMRPSSSSPSSTPQSRTSSESGDQSFKKSSSSSPLVAALPLSTVSSYLESKTFSDAPALSDVVIPVRSFSSVAEFMKNLFDGEIAPRDLGWMVNDRNSKNGVVSYFYVIVTAIEVEGNGGIKLFSNMSFLNSSELSRVYSLYLKRAIDAHIARFRIQVLEQLEAVDASIFVPSSSAQKLNEIEEAIIHRREYFVNLFSTNGRDTSYRFPESHPQHRNIIPHSCWYSVMVSLFRPDSCRGELPKQHMLTVEESRMIELKYAILKYWNEKLDIMLSNRLSSSHPEEKQDRQQLQDFPHNLHYPEEFQENLPAFRYEKGDHRPQDVIRSKTSVTMHGGYNDYQEGDSNFACEVEEECSDELIGQIQKGEYSSSTGSTSSPFDYKQMTDIFNPQKASVAANDTKPKKPRKPRQNKNMTRQMQ